MKNKSAIISVYCETLSTAEEIYDSLLDEFNKVVLIDFPYITECGIYKWEVE